MLTNLLVLSGIQLLAVMSPGPDFFLVIKNSLLYSRKSSFMTALGIATGCILISLVIIVTLLIVGNQFAQTFKFFYLFLLGSLYLVYLGILSAIESVEIYKESKLSTKNLKSNSHTTNASKSTSKEITPNTSGSNANRSNRFSFMNGLFCNLLNPKAWIYFFSVFLATQNYGVTQIFQMGISIGLIFIITLAWFSGLGYALGSGFIKNKLESYKLWITITSAIGFFGFGIFLGIAGLKTIS